jgi:hypothetical protein
MEALICNRGELDAILRVNEETLRETFREVSEGVILDGFCNRFSGVFISPEEVANMHGVSKCTVIAYIKDGIIEAQQEKRYGHYNIRLSDALRFDFKQMRKNLKHKS